MAYFKFLPDIEYLSPFDSPTNDARILAKNLFRRIKIVDGANILDTAYLFDKYIIEEGDRPDNVALKVYGNSNFDWLVIFGAGIVHQRDEWPLSSQQLYDFAADRYGNDLNSIKYYRTTEVKDSSGRLILPAGNVVDKEFTIPNPDLKTSILNPVQGVTNYEYEYEENEKKREINLIKPQYKQRIFNELEDILKYKPDSSQYISKTLKTTENIKKKSP
tara:strand:+ start:1471 stop:2124 length:654 start_codon:yes stop_codon:yes gene_type:complete